MNTITKLTSIDSSLFSWCVTYSRFPVLRNGSRIVSRFGDGGFYLVLGICLALMEAVDGGTFLVNGLLAFAIELPLYILLKNTIKRDRPCDSIAEVTAVVVPSDKFSFPSGHSAAAFVFATVLAHYYPSLFFVSYAFAGLIGCSRVLLGVHYPCDIAAGAVLGISSGLVAISLYGLL